MKDLKLISSKIMLTKKLNYDMILTISVKIKTKKIRHERLLENWMIYRHYRRNFEMSMKYTIEDDKGRLIKQYK